MTSNDYHGKTLTITEAMRAVDAEYSEECRQARKDPLASAFMGECMRREYEEIDQELPDYLSDIMRVFAAKNGAQEGDVLVLPPEVYQMARMCFRLGMRVQRKLDHPEQATTIIWRTDERLV